MRGSRRPSRVAPLGRGNAAGRVHRCAVGAPPPNKPRPCDLLLDALATSVTSDRRTAAASLRQAMHVFLDEQLPDDEVIKRGMVASLTAMGLWDVDSWEILSTRQIELARTSGAIAPLVVALKGHAVMLALSGDFEAVSELVERRLPSRRSPECNWLRLPGCSSPGIAVGREKQQRSSLRRATTHAFWTLGRLGDGDTQQRAGPIPGGARGGRAGSDKPGRAVYSHVGAARGDRSGGAKRTTCTCSPSVGTAL